MRLNPNLTILIKWHVHEDVCFIRKTISYAAQSKFDNSYKMACTWGVCFIRKTNSYAAQSKFDGSYKKDMYMRRIYFVRKTISYAAQSKFDGSYKKTCTWEGYVLFLWLFMMTKRRSVHCEYYVNIPLIKIFFYERSVIPLYVLLVLSSLF